MFTKPVTANVGGKEMTIVAEKLGPWPEFLEQTFTEGIYEQNGIVFHPGDEIEVGWRNADWGAWRSHKKEDWEVQWHPGCFGGLIPADGEDKSEGVMWFKNVPGTNYWERMFSHTGHGREDRFRKRMNCQ